MAATARGALYKVAAEPGEDDAYGAPTKVGPMSKSLIDKMMREADAGLPGSGVRFAAKTSERVPEQPMDIAVVYEDDANEAEPTLMHEQAQATAFAVKTQVMPAIVPPVSITVPLPYAAPPVPHAAPRYASAPRPAAFPEWLAVPATVDLARRSRDREAVLAVVAAAVLGASSIALWLFA